MEVINGEIIRDTSEKAEATAVKQAERCIETIHDRHTEEYVGTELDQKSKSRQQVKRKNELFWELGGLIHKWNINYGAGYVICDNCDFQNMQVKNHNKQRSCDHCGESLEIDASTEDWQSNSIIQKVLEHRSGYSGAHFDKMLRLHMTFETKGAIPHDLTWSTLCRISNAGRYPQQVYQPLIDAAIKHTWGRTKIKGWNNALNYRKLLWRCEQYDEPIPLVTSNQEIQNLGEKEDFDDPRLHERAREYGYSLHRKDED